MTDPGSDVSQWTIGQLAGKLKPSHLYSLAGIAVVALSGAFSLGAFAGRSVDTVRMKSNDIIVFEADNYGVNRADHRFQAIMRWEPPSEQNYSFDSKITETHAAWAFVRLRPTSDSIWEARIEKSVGPLPIRNGSTVEVPLSDELLFAYTDRETWMQLIVFALPKGFKPEEGKQIKDYSNDAKVLLSASVRGRP